MKTLRQIGSRKIGLLALFSILAFARLSHGAEDVAFFEKMYQTKITGVKAIEEYDDPDKFYSAIAKQLGIPELAMEAAAQNYGWKKDDGQRTGAMVGRTPGQWQVMISRIAISPDTKRPDPDKMEVKMVCIDDDKTITFIAKDDLAVPDFSKGMPDVKLERKQNIDGQEAYRLTTTLGSKEFSTTLAKFLGAGWRKRALTANEKFSLSMARSSGAEVSLDAYENANLPGVEIRVSYLKEKKGDAHARIDVQVFRSGPLVRNSGSSLSPDGTKRLEVTRPAGGGDPDGIAVFDAGSGKKLPVIRVMDAETAFAVFDSASGKKLASGSIGWYAKQGFFYWETSSRLWGFGSDGEYFKLIEFRADGSAGETKVDGTMPVPRVVWDNLPSSLQREYKAEQGVAPNP